VGRLGKGEDDVLSLLKSLLSSSATNSYVAQLGSIDSLKPPGTLGDQVLAASLKRLLTPSANKELDDQALVDTLKRLSTPSANKELDDQALVDTLKRLSTPSSNKALGDQATAEALKRLLPDRRLGGQAITADVIRKLLESTGGKKVEKVKRQVFYSFHFDNDVMRVQQIRNIGAIEDNKPVSANDWEEVKKKGDAGIKAWINDNMKDRSCVLVLVGEETAKRPWVKYEIQKAWEDKKGLLGIYIHNIKCPRNGTCDKGPNPFDEFTFTDGDKKGEKLSTVVKCYNPKASDAYNDIKDNLEDWIETAIASRK